MISEIKERFIFFAHLFLKDMFHFEKSKLFLKVMPYTMVGYKRLANVYVLARQAVQRGLQGAFVECGVWRGGAAAVMAYVAQKEGKGRETWLLDSFEGLPEPTSIDGETAKKFVGKCFATREEVEKLLFSILKLNRDSIHIEKGWFENTLPQAKSRIGMIAILRLDADWYQSTKIALENLYENVVPGGYVIIDDYGHWEGCKKAVDEFLEERRVNPVLHKIDYTGVYFRKPL